MYDELKNILTTSFQAKESEVTPEASLTDLGLDSLDVVELSLVLKANCGVEVTDDDLIDLNSVGAIAEALESRSARL